MMKKRIAALLLVVCTLLGCLSGCGKKDEPSKELEPGEIPTITVGLKQNANVSDYETNEFTLWIEEQLGVNLEFMLLSSNNGEAVQQISLMMAGGEKLPDIIWGLTLSKTAIMEYGEDGYLVDLAPYFGTISPHFDEAISKIALEEDKARVLKLGTDSETGAMYGFPTYQHSAGADNATNHVLINTKWLEAVGEDMPTTPDELYTVLKKFRDEDPNGNGQKDELPMVGSTKVSRGDTLEWVINAYIYCNDAHFFNLDGGKLTVPYITDEYREAMIFLNKLYKEELLSPQVFTIATTNEMKEVMTPSTGTAITGVTGGHSQLCYHEGSEIVFDYAYLPAIDAGTGKGGYRQQSDSTIRFTSYVTTDCEDPELAFSVLDFLCSEEAFLRMRYGVPGRDWEYAEEGMLDMFGEQAFINVLDTSVFSTQNNACWHALETTVADYSTHMMYSPVAEDGADFNTRITEWKDKFIAEMLKDPIKDELVFSLAYPGSVATELSELNTPIHSYVGEARALFVTGTLDPSSDRDWNEYLSNLDMLGLTRYQEIMQKCYDDMQKAD